MPNFSPLHTHGSHPIHLANLEGKKKKTLVWVNGTTFCAYVWKKKKPLWAMRLLALNCFEKLS
jgi:hypothetical protein